MGAIAILQQISTILAGLEYAPGAKYLATVQVWDADAPDAQLNALQDAERRLALVLHEDTKWANEKRGRVQVARGRVDHWYFAEQR